MTHHQCYPDHTAETYQALGYWEPMTLGRHLENWGRKFDGRTALVEGERQITYGEFCQDVRETALGFLEMGIQKQDNVVVQLPNSIFFVTTIFALFRLGAVPVLAMPAHREADLDGIFEVAKPTAYIVAHTHLGFNYGPMAEGLMKRHACVKYLVRQGADQDISTRNSSGSALLDNDPPSYTDTALLLLSGGTTGTPKLIPRTHADYAYNARASALKCNMNETSVYLAVLPVAHNFPLACPGIIGTFFSGGTVVFSKTTSPDETFPLIEKHGVTITALVPAMVNLWLQVLEWEEADLSSLEILQVGGSPLDENLARQIMPKMNCRLQQVFGMAEGLLCYTDPGDPDHLILSCQGKPLSPHDEIRVIDENGNRVSPGQSGELLVRGPYTIRGYYRAPEQNIKDFTPDGFYRSGDIVLVTEEGNVRVMGRIKEQINRAGEKIVAAEVESYLNAFSGIRDSALVGVPDDELGEKSCAFVIPAQDPVALSQVHDHLDAMGVARYKIPDQLECVDSWPLTSVGKIDKKALLKTVFEKKQDRFHEKRLAFSGDPLSFACRIIESLGRENYLLYENKETYSLGLGKAAQVTVYADKTVLAWPGNTHELKNKGFGYTLDKALAMLPFSGWRVYGTADFELSHTLFQLELPDQNRPLLHLFVPEAELRIEKEGLLLRAKSRDELNTLLTAVETCCSPEAETGVGLPRGSECRWEDVPEITTHDSEHYKQLVKCAVEEIRSPQYRKVILSRKIPLKGRIDMIASFLAGRKANTPARSFILKSGDFAAAGFSPETVVEVDENRTVSTQPLAGTRSMGSGMEEEIKLMEELLSDSKEIAEHAISIKLAFEEMQQVCEADSITMSNFMAIAKRGTVQHLASRLKGMLKEECNPWHAFSILFPAVTATGIPKKEATLAIGKHEAEPRGLYSGCVMTYDQDGTMDAALVLRSFFQDKGKAWLRAGAGIVDLSEPERELEETCEKLRSVSRQIVYI